MWLLPLPPPETLLICIMLLSLILNLFRDWDAWSITPMYGRSLMSNTVTRFLTFSYSCRAYLRASFFLKMNTLLITALVFEDIAAMREKSLYSSLRLRIFFLMLFVTGGILKASSLIFRKVSSSILSVRLISTTFLRSIIISCCSYKSFKTWNISRRPSSMVLHFSISLRVLLTCT